MRQRGAARVSRIVLSVLLSLSMALGGVPVEAWAEALEEAMEVVGEATGPADEEQVPEQPVGAQEAAPLPEAPDVADDQESAAQPTEPDGSASEVAIPEEEPGEDLVPLGASSEDDGATLGSDDDSTDGGVLLPESTDDGTELLPESTGGMTNIYPYGQFRQDEAYKDLALVNQTRSSVGSRTLTWSKELENVAMQRVVETAVYLSHTRPNGTSCFTAFESGHGYWNASVGIWYIGTYAPGENIALASRLSIQSMHDLWVNSSGHYSTMIKSEYRSFACAVYESNGCYYYVEAYSSKPYASSTSDRSTAYGGAWVEVADNLLSLSVSQSSNITVDVGSSLALNASIPATVIGSNYGERGLSYEVLPQNLGQYYSSNTSIARISGKSTLVGVAPGSTTVYAYAFGNTSKKVTFNVTVKAKVVDVTGVSLNRSTLSLATGSSSTLTATVSPSNATNKSVTWESSNTSVATVSSGTVKAVKPGTATITVRTANGKTATCTVTVTGISINSAIIAKPSSYTYTGSAIKPTPTVTLGGKTLTPGTDFTYSYANNTNAGTATVTANGIGNYSGSVSTTFTINRRSVAIPTSRYHDYTGEMLDAPWSSTRDYSISGDVCATNAGTYTLTASLTYAGNTMWSDGTTGNKTVTWFINPVNIRAATVSSIGSQTYTGSALTPAPTITWNGRTLKKGTDYTLSYSNNTNVGTATITITGKGNFASTRSVTFAIVAAAKPSVANATVTGVTNRTYNKAAQTQSPTVTLGGRTLTKGTDYTLSYSNNTNAGTATMTITGEGSYTGTKSVTFAIARKAIPIPDPPKPEVYSDHQQSAFSMIGPDYSMDGSYNTSAVGSYPCTASLNDKANTMWSDGTTADKILYKVITPASIGDATVAKIADQTHAGSAVKPEPKVTWNGKTLKKGTDYTLSYKNNTAVGTATVTITGKGNFKGTKSVTFKIVAGEAPETARVAVYRLYNWRTSEHLWTTSPTEYAQLPVITEGDWRQEGVAWYAPDGKGEPVYRLYNRAMGDHYYSKSQGEIDILTAKYGWNVDNNGAPAFWSAAQGDEGAIPLYCVYNEKLKKGQHHFTASAGERDYLVANAGWRYEGVSFYGYEK